jgi:hypothetical protein
MVAAPLARREERFAKSCRVILVCAVVFVELDGEQ